MSTVKPPRGPKVVEHPRSHDATRFDAKVAEFRVVERGRCVRIHRGVGLDADDVRDHEMRGCRHLKSTLDATFPERTDTVVYDAEGHLCHILHFFGKPRGEVLSVAVEPDEFNTPYQHLEYDYVRHRTRPGCEQSRPSTFRTVRWSDVVTIHEGRGLTAEDLIALESGRLPQDRSRDEYEPFDVAIYSKYAIVAIIRGELGPNPVVRSVERFDGTEGGGGS